MATKKLSRAELTRRMADPNLRATLHLSQLSPKYRKMRLDAQQRNAPIFEGADITSADIAHLRKPQEALQFGPARQQLAQQNRNLEAQRTRDVGPGGYFDQYQQAVQGAQAQQAAVAQQSQAAIAGVVGAGQQASQASTNATAAAGQAQAAKTGGGFDEAGYRQMADAAAATRQQMGAGQVAATGQRAVLGNSFLGGLVGAAVQGKIQQSGKINTAKEGLSQKAEDLDAQTAIWRDKFFQDQVSEAQQRRIEAQTFGLKKDTLDQQLKIANANNLSDENIAALRAKATKNAADGKAAPVPWFTQAQWSTMSPDAKQQAYANYKKIGKSGPKAKSGYAAPGAISGFWKAVQQKQNLLKAWDEDQRMAVTGDPAYLNSRTTLKKKFPNINDFLTYLKAHTGQDRADLIIDMARRLHAHNNLSKKQVNDLKDAGISIGGRYDTSGAVHPGQSQFG